MTAALVLTCAAALLAAGDEPTADEHPLSERTRAELRKEFDREIADATRAVEKDPRDVGAYSRRGDAYFFRGDYPEAVADYNRMVELRPETGVSHWRRGIALFYAEEYEEAARQFERYHGFDDVDRENGIWRFLSQAKADGLEEARKNLLPYDTRDREPLPLVYRLFAGTKTADEVLEEIRAAKVDDREREKRLFYAQLYVGLDYTVRDKPDLARRHLREAVANTWGPGAGYGPRYMWHVARLQYETLAETGAPKAP